MHCHLSRVPLPLTSHRATFSLQARRQQPIIVGHAHHHSPNSNCSFRHFTPIDRRRRRPFEAKSNPILLSTPPRRRQTHIRGLALSTHASFFPLPFPSSLPSSLLLPATVETAGETLSLSLSLSKAPARLKDFALCWMFFSLASTGFLEHLTMPTDGALSTKCLQTPCQ